MEAELGGDAVATYEQQLAREGRVDPPDRSNDAQTFEPVGDDASHAAECEHEQREREEAERADRYDWLTRAITGGRIYYALNANDPQRQNSVHWVLREVARYTNERAQLVEEA